MLVVGSRGAGGFNRLLTRSTGRAMQYGLRDIGPKVPARTDFRL
jgi:hypothetical protein